MGKPFVERFAERIVSNPWRVLLSALVCVAIASSGIGMLNFSASYRMFFSEDNPQLLALEALEDTYGKNENLVFLVVPEDGDAASELALTAALWLTEEAWLTPYSRRVDSISNFQHTTAVDDDLYVRDLVDPQAVEEAEARSRIREVALADPRLAGSILGTKGNVSVVSVTIAFPEEDQLQAVTEIAEFARTLAGEAEERFPGIDLRVVGTVMISQAFAQASMDSQAVFMPTCLLIMAVILGVITRGFAGVVAAGIIMIFSVLASVGLGGWVGLTFSPPTAPAPTIVLTIVVANCVHLLVALQHRMRKGESKRVAIIESMKHNLRPVFLASLTTALGFLSFNFSEVPPYHDLGNFVAFGIISCFLLSVTLLPALFALLPVRAASHRSIGGFTMKSLADLAIRHRKALFVGWTIIVLAMIWAIPRNELNDVLVHFFDESVEFRRDTDFMDEHLSGNTVLDYSLQAHTEGGVTDPVFLADVARFADWFRQQPSVRNVAVVTDTFRQLNMSMHGDDPDAYHLPESQELAAQYLLLYELSLPQGLDLNNQIDTTRSSTRLTVSAKTLYSRELLELNARAKAWAKENAPHIASVNSAGASEMFAYIGQRNIRAMIIGTVLVLLAISAILLFGLRSLRLGLASIVPNLLPAVMGFGIWGLTVGQVGLALSVVVSMTVGIVVDDTVHFLSKYRYARHQLGQDPEAAIHYAFDTAGRALFTTTVVLVTGFLVFVLSPFIPTAQVGILTSLIIAFALIADLSLLPALLMAIDRRATKPSGS